MVPDRDRRRLLEATGVAAASALAGCRFERRTPTPAPGERSYSVRFENRINEDELEGYPPIDGTPPAELTIIVETDPPDGPETDILEESLQLDAGETRTLADVFSPEGDGTSYVVRVKLGEFDRYDSFGHDPANHSDAYRFTPGEEGEPSSDTFVITVRDTEPETDFFAARVEIGVQGEP